MKHVTALSLALLTSLLAVPRGHAQGLPDSQRLADPAPAGEPLETVRSVRPEVYTLGEGDRVFVDIFGLPDYSREYGVLMDGTLNLPLVGSVFVKGLTLPEASRAIEQLYQTIVRRPVVTLDVQRPRPLQIAIVGAVNRPGTYSIATVERATQVDRGDRDQRVTVTRAISQAGGITQVADVRNVQVFRPSPVGGTSQTFTANLWDLLRQGDLGQDLALRDGDTVVVPEAAVIDNAEITEVATATFSADTIDVYVVGEVGAPGLVQVRPNTPLNQALLAAGGFDLVRAARGAVRLVRLNPDGTVSDRTVPVDFAAAVNEQTNPAMRPNDTIVVGRSTLTAATDTLGQILAPLGGVLNFVRIVEPDRDR